MTLPPNQPIIYQNGSPNFENQPQKPKSPWDFDLFKKLLEVNAGLLLLIFLTLVVVGGMAFFSRSKNNPTQKANLAENTTPEQTAQPKIAASGSKSPVFISDQVFSIDKAFNSQPIQIKLTVNG